MIPLLAILCRSAFGTVPLDAPVAVRLMAVSDPGSDTWDQEVRFHLLAAYDTNQSNALDRRREILAIPCRDWVALDESLALGGRFPGLRLPYGLAEDTRFAGHLLGIHPRQRGLAERRLEACGLAVAGPEATWSAPARLFAAMDGDENGPSFTALHVAMQGRFDRDHSGAIDAPEEAAAVPCDAWRVLDVLLSERGGLAALGLGSSEPWTAGQIGLSVRVADVADEHIRACVPGAGPTDGPRPGIVEGQLEAMLPGNPEWERQVRATLVRAYDGDASGLLDQPVEVLAVKCEDWSVIRRGLKGPEGRGPSLELALGLRDAGPFAGAPLGLAPGVRDVVDRALAACPAGR